DADGQTDDRADGGDRDTDGEGADHPPAVKRDLAAADVAEGCGQRKEKKQTEDDRSGSLRGNTHWGQRGTDDECGETAGRGGNEIDATGNAVPLGMAGAQRGVELKRAECHEKEGRKDVNQR